MKENRALYNNGKQTRTQRQKKSLIGCKRSYRACKKDVQRQQNSVEICSENEARKNLISIDDLKNTSNSYLKSITDVRVGSIRMFKKKRAKKVYLAKTVDASVGSLTVVKVPNQSSDDRWGNHSSNEEVYNIIEYETITSDSNFYNKNKNHSEIIGDHASNELTDAKNVENTDTINTSELLRSKLIYRNVKESSTQTSRRCDILRVGIATHTDIKKIKRFRSQCRNFISVKDSESSRIRVSLTKREYSEHYLKALYHSLVRMGIDYYSLCASDSYIHCRTDLECNIRWNNSQNSKSCPNVFNNIKISKFPATYDSHINIYRKNKTTGNEISKANFLFRKFYEILINNNNCLKKTIPGDFLEIIKKEKFTGTVDNRKHRTFDKSKEKIQATSMFMIENLNVYDTASFLKKFTLVSNTNSFDNAEDQSQSVVSYESIIFDKYFRKIKDWNMNKEKYGDSKKTPITISTSRVFSTHLLKHTKPLSVIANDCVSLPSELHQEYSLDSFKPSVTLLCKFEKATISYTHPEDTEYTKIMPYQKSIYGSKKKPDTNNYLQMHKSTTTCSPCFAPQITTIFTNCKCCPNKRKVDDINNKYGLCKSLLNRDLWNQMSKNGMQYKNEMKCKTKENYCMKKEKCCNKSSNDICIRNNCIEECSRSAKDDKGIDLSCTLSITPSLTLGQPKKESNVTSNKSKVTLKCCQESNFDNSENICLKLHGNLKLENKDALNSILQPKCLNSQSDSKEDPCFYKCNFKSIKQILQHCRSKPKTTDKNKTLEKNKESISTKPEILDNKFDFTTENCENKIKAGNEVCAPLIKKSSIQIEDYFKDKNSLKCNTLNNKACKNQEICDMTLTDVNKTNEKVSDADAKSDLIIKNSNTNDRIKENGTFISPRVERIPTYSEKSTPSYTDMISRSRLFCRPDQDIVTNLPKNRRNCQSILDQSKLSLYPKEKITANSEKYTNKCKNLTKNNVDNSKFYRFPTRENYYPSTKCRLTSFPKGNLCFCPKKRDQWSEVSNANIKSNSNGQYDPLRMMNTTNKIDNIDVQKIKCCDCKNKINTKLDSGKQWVDQNRPSRNVLQTMYSNVHVTQIPQKTKSAELDGIPKPNYYDTDHLFEIRLRIIVTQKDETVEKNKNKFNNTEVNNKQVNNQLCTEAYDPCLFRNKMNINSASKCRDSNQNFEMKIVVKNFSQDKKESSNIKLGEIRDSKSILSKNDLEQFPKISEGFTNISAKNCFVSKSFSFHEATTDLIASSLKTRYKRHKDVGNSKFGASIHNINFKKSDIEIKQKSIPENNYSLSSIKNTKKKSNNQLHSYAILYQNQRCIDCNKNNKEIIKNKDELKSKIYCTQTEKNQNGIANFRDKSRKQYTIKPKRKKNKTEKSKKHNNNNEIKQLRKMVNYLLLSDSNSRQTPLEESAILDVYTNFDNKSLSYFNKVTSVPSNQTLNKEMLNKENIIFHDYVDKVPTKEKNMSLYHGVCMCRTLDISIERRDRGNICRHNEHILTKTILTESFEDLQNDFLKEYTKHTNKCVDCNMESVNRHDILLGIFNESEVAFFKNDSDKPVRKRSREKERRKKSNDFKSMPLKIVKSCDILQCHDAKKAVLEIYNGNIKSNASFKLPKFMNDLLI